METVVEKMNARWMGTTEEMQMKNVWQKLGIKKKRPHE